MRTAHRPWQHAVQAERTRRLVRERELHQHPAVRPVQQQLQVAAMASFENTTCSCREELALQTRALECSLVPQFDCPALRHTHEQAGTFSIQWRYLQNGYHNLSHELAMGSKGKGRQQRAVDHRATHHELTEELPDNPFHLH